MNAFMIAVLVGIQYGVPLEVFVSKFAHMRFEPSGMTNRAHIRIAKSIPDYIFRCFLDAHQAEIGILSAADHEQLAAGNGHSPCGPRRTTLGHTRARRRPDGALQRLGGRGRVREVRRPQGAHGRRATPAATARRLGLRLAGGAVGPSAGRRPGPHATGRTRALRR